MIRKPELEKVLLHKPAHSGHCVALSSLLTPNVTHTSTQAQSVTRKHWRVTLDADASLRPRDSKSIEYCLSSLLLQI